MVKTLDMSTWNFITNHGVVLVIVSQRSKITALEISQAVGITERAVLRILSDLEEAGYITKTKDGRANIYSVHKDLPLPHPIFKDVAVGDLLDVIKSNVIKTMTDD